MAIQVRSSLLLSSMVVLAIIAASNFQVMASPPADPSLTITTETRERIVIIRGLPYRLGRVRSPSPLLFCFCFCFVGLILVVIVQSLVLMCICVCLSCLCVISSVKTPVPAFPMK